MTVYIDNYRARYGRMVMCHMAADTNAELHSMADRIGVARRWFQQKPGAPWRNHYDVCLAKRALAVEHGALEVGRTELARIMARKKFATR